MCEWCLVFASVESFLGEDLCEVCLREAINQAFWSIVDSELSYLETLWSPETD